jgi:hypothetical protein
MWTFHQPMDSYHEMLSLNMQLLLKRYINVSCLVLLLLKRFVSCSKPNLTATSNLHDTVHYL